MNQIIPIKLIEKSKRLKQPSEDSLKNFSFHKYLSENSFPQLKRDGVSILQLNLGKLCNQACHHCHVEAGPKRTELMSWEVMEKVLTWIKPKVNQIQTIDLTGGAPEMNPDFRRFVDALLAMGIKDIITRCNLTILTEPGYEYLAQWYGERDIHIVSSLPCYSSENVDQQRGKGVFGRSIKALQMLNDLGYSHEKNKPLDLVYNPNGALLPPEETALTADYRKRLKADFNIEFNELFVLTNLPVKRFEHMLVRENIFESYMQLLVDNFNSSTLNHVMCRQTLSVDWTGRVYDCDFNQMLEMPTHYNDEKSTNHPSDFESDKENDINKYLWNIDLVKLENACISTGHHCFGCTAGSGSSCGGSLA